MLGQNALTHSLPAEAELHHMDWSTLRLLNAYRAFLLISFAVANLLPPSTISLGKVDPALFENALLVYLALALTFSLTITFRMLPMAVQFFVQSYIDIIFLCVVMYCSGGVESGLSILLVILISIISHCTSSKYAMLFVAMTSVMILTQEILTAQVSGIQAAQFPQAAVSGITLFAAGYLISVVLPVRLKALFKTQHKEIQTLSTSNSIMTSDLKLAADLQANLLPSPQTFDNVDVAGFCKPALFVAGDIYDYFILARKYLVLYMADVVGHGAASAMISYAVHNQLNPRKDGMCYKNFERSKTASEFILSTLQELNSSFTADRQSDHYFTLHFSILNLETGVLHFSQCGHPLPILFKKNDMSMQEVGEGGMPVGMFDGAIFEVSSCKLEPGDQFFVFSDGATECFSPGGEQFGVERLMKNVRKSAEIELTGFKSQLINELKHWQGSEDFADDVSLLRIKML